jgi:3-hydroxy-9,10-secoandrosta-1,3,5(10)-triene-9,17-dione monooxygenase
VHIANDARITVPVPDPGLTPAGIVRRARDMVPLLRERQAECEALGRLPEDVNQAFVDAGFYRILQPRRFGGYEFDMPTFAQVMIEVARGCPSSGWVLALTAGHAIMLSAFFPESAQIDIYGNDGEFRGPSRTPPRVAATPEAGGYVLNGSWDYVSGCDIATHVIGGIGVRDSAHNGTAPEARMAVVDRADFTIVDDWQTIGMRGTGSRTVVVHDVFVPADRTIVPPRDAFNARQAPGRRVHRNPMYVAGRLTSVLLEEMAAVAVGIAKGALDIYEQDMWTRRTSYPPFARRSEVPDYHRHYGEAWSLIHTAEATTLRIAEQYMEFARQDAEEGVPFSDERDQQLQVLEQSATRLAGDAVDLLFRTGGTHSAQADSMLQRYYRDMSVVNTHIAAQSDRGAEALGRVHFTGSVASPTVLQQTPL